MKELHNQMVLDTVYLASSLSKFELASAVTLSQMCTSCSSEELLHEELRRFGKILGYEFILYAHTPSIYRETDSVVVRNVSNPEDWMALYGQKNYVASDPVRREMEIRLAAGQSRGLIEWDAYQRPVSAIEHEIIQQRSRFGLRSGFSSYCNSPRLNACFLVSFATQSAKQISTQALTLTEFIVPQLNRWRKRLEFSDAVAKLTIREQSVANWLTQGKSNQEMACILDISEATVKYHIRSILSKLGTNNRLAAVALLVAERCLGN